MTRNETEALRLLRLRDRTTHQIVVALGYGGYSLGFYRVATMLASLRTRGYVGSTRATGRDRAVVLWEWIASETNR